MEKIKNILIFVVIAGVMFGGYMLFIKPDPETASLVSSNTGAPAEGTEPLGTAGTPATAEFLTLLLNVKNIKLEDKIFSDPAFQKLTDSSIVLNQEGNEGRINPFAKLGTDAPPPEPAPEVTNGAEAITPADADETPVSGESDAEAAPEV